MTFIYNTTDPPQCSSGFVSDDVFEYIMRSTEITSRTSQQLPVILCPGVSIEKLIVGATASLEGQPQIMFCDCVQSPCSYGYCDQPLCDFENCKQLTTLNTTSYLNVYEHEPSSSEKLQFPAVINTFQIIYYYYWRCLLVDCIYRPLVAVELSGKYGSSICINLNTL